MKQFWNKYKGYIKNYSLVFITLFAGIHLLLYPKEVHPLIIRGVGLIWILDAGPHILKIIKKYHE